MSTRILAPALRLSMLVSLAVLPGVSFAQEVEWIDSFPDTSLIESMNDTIQVTETTGSFGTSFTPYGSNPLLTIESSDPWDAEGDPTYQVPAAVHPDVIHFPGGMDGYEFWMIFTPFGEVPPGGSGTPDYWWERMTLVRSHDGINWEKTPDYTNPLVSPGAPGEWDDGFHADPDFIYAPGKGPSGESWFLYYTGCGGGGCHIALALSHDGKNYTKYGTNYVFEAFRCPTVIYDEATGVFQMWYNVGSFDIGYATSTNGIDWVPYHPTTPGTYGHIVFQGTPGTFDAYGVTHMDVIYHAGQYWMYYLAKPTSAYGGLVVGVATSPDGINWTQHPDPVVVPQGQTWEWTDGGTRAVQTLYRPSAAVVGDTMYLYYPGGDQYIAYPGCYDYEIGLAFSTETDPDGHVELEKESGAAEYASAPGTMAWYHMNEGPPAPIYPGEYTPLDPALAWYHMNEGTGDTAGDSGGSIADDGTLEGSVWTTGLYDDGVAFNGSGRITVPHSTELSPSGAVTIEAWVNPSVHKANNYVAIKMTPSSADYAYGMKVESTYVTGSSEVGGVIWDGAGNFYTAYGGSVPVDTWTHVAMTYEMDPTNPTQIRLFQNGVEVTYRYGAAGVATDTIPAGTLIRSNTGPLNIGVIPVGTPQYYQGTMDELRILGRALTPAEIAADGTFASPEVLDSSGNENHGSPRGGADWTTGLFSYGMSFDGSTGRVEIPHDGTLNTDEQVTIEAWINPSVDKSNNYVLSKMANPDGSDIAYALKLENTYTTSYSEIGAAITDPSGNQYFAYGGSVPLGTWTHVAMTYEMDPVDPTQIRLYQDGVEVAYRYGAPGAATDTIPPGTHMLNNTGPVNIGLLPYTTPLYFQGTMDEVRLLSSALTPGEILADSGTGHLPSGDLTSVLITPRAGRDWDRFYATDALPAGTGIQYSIQDASGIPIADPVLPGDDISSLGTAPLRLHAELTTSAPAFTPVLDEWSVTTVAAAFKCSDGLDNDADGFIDWNGGPLGEPADPGCAGASDASEKDETGTFPCDDGMDNDGDGGIDFDPVTFSDPGDATTPPGGVGDPGCGAPSWGTESPQCQDGIHNDADGRMDYDAGLSVHGSADSAGPDPECLGRAWWNSEAPWSSSPIYCGLGAELALLLPPLMWLWRRRSRH